MRVRLKCNGINSSPYMGPGLECNYPCQWEGEAVLRQEEIHDGEWSRKCPNCKAELTAENKVG